MHKIRDPKLAAEGERRIEWTRRRMPVLNLIKERYGEEKPLEGMNIAACLHVTAETANLLRTLKAGGANISLTASNPLSTQDDVAAASSRDINVFAFRGESEEEYYEHIDDALRINPDVVLDDGADLIATIHERHADLWDQIRGGCEETTTGVIRLRALDAGGKLRFPIIAVNDAETKMMFDNRYGTGQSTIHGVMEATNTLIAGRTVVVAGYGWCGRGIASRARGLGANVIIVETAARKALEAVMDGFSVTNMREASEIGDIFITATGDTSVIRKEHFELMKNQAILANAGHFNVEIDIPDLEDIAIETKEVKGDVTEFVLKDGRSIYLLAEGRLVNLACAYGHPPEVMDMSFANQALCVKYIAENRLEDHVYSVPKEIDEEVASLKLESLGIEIEELTDEQRAYLSSWEIGT